ncbi:Crp/Fnr family transcriptional regulator [Boseaceae bacterium BT-24-1]|uniref:Crp/Fnr family transcriptional regulator n=1 Tax=Bosea sp. Tri-44 TaxID=1972137 RepID=UPI00100F4994|nr:Crp/Fnr family transcriptional regulator [Bosea sp. Tri-44]MCV9936550.1 Crp/Fnr family transcriptional regulator [Boseaceae bacterium BT-24-1]RXT54463.1 Crp/Fnr family transcriptional regulator [Bosea sp. Tri-44]
MISEDELRRIAAWSNDLTPEEFEEARRGTSIKAYGKGAHVCHVGDRLESWTGVADGLLKMSTTSRSGKSATLAGLRGGAWFGEGTIIKNEARRYDLVALRESKVALMRRQTFFWLFEHSAAFNRFLVHQFNERLAQFIGLAEYDRMLGATGRLARNLAWLFNPILYPNNDRTLTISQEELGLLAGISRQMANQSLAKLAELGLVEVGHNEVTILDLERLARYEG